VKTLLFGADGQLGSQLASLLPAALAPLGEVVALTRRNGGDVTDPQAVQRAVHEHQPQVIVNASAYTAVDRAESEPDAAFAVNALACETMARAAHEAGAWFVHYSTDYVFDGSGTQPWRESDATAPLSVYGASKLAGEKAIQAVCPRHVILRTSWVYEPGRDNFIGAILKAACKRDSLTVVDDQWGTPTRARTLAQATAHVLRSLQPGHAGIYHVAAAGETNRFELARFALQCAQARGWPLRATADRVSATSTRDMPSPARRPLNSRLDCSRFERTFGYSFAPWTVEVQAAIDEWPMMAGG
jgi:dTDP-4-dehydrorhamnose reductase